MSELSGSLNLSGIKEAAEKRMTRPGTLDVFTIKKVSFEEAKSEKKTPMMIVQFDRTEDSFSHSFMLKGADDQKTRKLLERIVTLVKAATGEILDEVSYQGLKIKLENKQVALKVTAKIVDDTQKGRRAFADLPFGGFAKPSDELAFLQFDKDQTASIEEALQIMEQSSSRNADQEGPSGGNEAFATPRRKF
jgi:hypothetical protein